MKVIYIAGPYRDKRGAFYIGENIANARKRALEVWGHGGVALCPHMNTAFFDGAAGIQDEVWLAGDLNLLERCDAVWAIAGWSGSSGARKEIKHAEECNIPVFYFLQEVIEFLNG